jgi:non-specific serine/threonine protein kinase
MQTLAANEELVPAPPPSRCRRRCGWPSWCQPPQAQPARAHGAARRRLATRRTATSTRTSKPRPAPSELCAERNFFTRPFCLQRECEQAQYRQHPQCVELQRQHEARMTRPGPL